MTQFVSIHRAPGLSREEFAGNAWNIYKASNGTFLQSSINLAAGSMVTIFEAERARPA